MSSREAVLAYLEEKRLEVEKKQGWIEIVENALDLEMWSILRACAHSEPRMDNTYDWGNTLYNLITAAEKETNVVAVDALADQAQGMNCPNTGNTP